MSRARLLAFLGVALLVVATGWAMWWLRPVERLAGDAPPVEEIVVERTELDDEGILLTLRADGSEPVRIAQIQVDGAYWRFEQNPPGPIGRLQTVQVRIPYPWEPGALHRILIITQTGLSFEHVVEVALPTPAPGAMEFAALGLLGVMIGVVPVAIGMLSYPLLIRWGQRGLPYLLALTVGLLLFLLFDTLDEGFEFVALAPPGLGAGTLFGLLTLLTTGILLFVGRWGAGGTLEGVRLATFVALGIGLHNFGEGLAVGAAFTAGEVALAGFLILGFTLHNLTEGVGIVAPMIGRGPRAWVFPALLLLAGLPTVPGAWLGAFAVTPFWVAVCFAIAAGAILQVVIEITLYLLRRYEAAYASPAVLSGLATGVGIMYATALFVPL